MDRQGNCSDHDLLGEYRQLNNQNERGTVLTLIEGKLIEIIPESFLLCAPTDAILGDLGLRIGDLGHS